MAEFRAAWWWIDRWRKSTAYTDMNAAQQGIYRNLLDEIWLRDNHAIPDDPRVLERASGDSRAWKKHGAGVLKRCFFRSENGWENETANEVIALAQKNREKARRWRARRGNATGNADGNGSPRVTNSVPASPSPSPSGKPLTGLSMTEDGARANGAPPPSKERIAQIISRACLFGVHEDRVREMLGAHGVEAVERANVEANRFSVRADAVDAWFDAVKGGA